eukprot:4056311-Pleurochrysis_carterae.AAC.1
MSNRRFAITASITIAVVPTALLSRFYHVFSEDVPTSCVSNYLPPPSFSPHFYLLLILLPPTCLCMMPSSRFLPSGGCV